MVRFYFFGAGAVKKIKRGAGAGAGAVKKKNNGAGAGAGAVSICFFGAGAVFLRCGCGFPHQKCGCGCGIPHFGVCFGVWHNIVF